MYHFVSFVWNPQDAGASAAAARLGDLLRHSPSLLTNQLSTQGLSVFTRAPRVRALTSYVLPQGRGIVLGRLFTQPSSAQPAGADVHIDDPMAEDIVRSGGRRLVDEYWGNYVAFLKAPHGTRTYVIRDCSGAIPCYRTRHANVEIVFSDIADLAALKLPSFTINHRYLAGFIYSSQLQIRECGFKQITEILAGECLEVSNDATRQFPIWDPRLVSTRRVVDNYEQAATSLKDTTQACIDAWARVHDGILLSLSGGLDSAIVLGCLSRATRAPQVTCFNQCIPGTLDDERRYARLASARAGLPLIEKPWGGFEFDAQLQSFLIAPKPSVTTMFRALQIRVANELATQTRADAIWTGQGGDHLFWAVRKSPSAADYVSHNGIRAGLIHAVADAARLSRKPYFSVLRSALHLGRSRAPWLPEDVVGMKAYFVNRDALGGEPDSYVSHPWVADAEDIPKGKQYQIRLLAEAVNRHRPIPGAEHIYQHHPLMSQPLMESCLQIPTFVLLRGGRKRALARDTFGDRVPVEIVQREDKGDAVAHIREIVKRSEPFLREILLNGILVGERIVSRSSLEPFLVEGQSFRPDQPWPLLACVAAEMWARTWQNKGLRAAA